MHYYKKNIGDYAKKAGRLSMIQHGAYTLLLDSCYDREQFPTLDEALEWTWASTKEEIEAVEFVLKRFFENRGGVYVQLRIEEEIAAFHAKSETNRKIASQREAKRKRDVTDGDQTSTKRVPDVDVSNTEHHLTINHKPITKNQELQTNNHKPKAFSIDAMLEVGPELALEFIRHRKAVKAPLSAIAWEQFVKEANKAGWSVEDAIRECISRGWRSFKADWVASKAGSTVEYQSNPFSDHTIEGEFYESS